MLRPRLAAVAAGLCRRHGVDPTLAGPSLRRLAGGPVPEPAEPATGEPVDVLGAAYLGELTRDVRLERGLFYTPLAVARRLTAEVLDPDTTGTVLDPACGAGGFLVAAAERLGSTDPVRGVDCDPVAVDLARVALALAGWSLTGRWSDPDGRVVVADGLHDPPPGERPAVVVGNPPFGSQLRRRTARSTEERARAAALLGPAVGAYTDRATLFLARAAELVGPRGRVAMIQPASVLRARDGAGARRRIAATHSLAVLDDVDDPAFEVGLPLVGVALRPRTTPAPRRAAAGGAPGQLGELATVSAGFRDAYYGVVPHVREAGGGEPDGRRTAALVTVGLVDPARVHWGERPVRFAKRRWSRPVVDVGALDSRLRDELHQPGRPRLLVASQTRIPEIAADDGTTVPVTPLIRVSPHDASDRWRLAALGASPVVARFARHEALGTGRSHGTIRLSAPLVRRFPLPADEAAWDQAAVLVAAAHGEDDPAARWRLLLEAATAMLDAHRCGDRSLVDAWREGWPRPDRRLQRSPAAPAERQGA